MKKSNIRLITFSAVCTAAVFVLTAYLHIPSHTGFVHIGDGIIFLCAALLPLPYAIFVGSVGAGLADVLSGFAIFAPGTVVIKALSVVFFARTKRIVSVRNIFALIPAYALCIGGYYLYDALIIGNFLSALAGIPGYAMQCLLSTVLFIALGLSFDKIGFKDKFLGDIKR